MSDGERIADILRFGRLAVELALESRRDERWKLALERALYLVGEAAAHLSPGVRQAIDHPWRSIIGLRNVLAHRYPDLDVDVLVTVARTRVPALIHAMEDYSS